MRPVDCVRTASDHLLSIAAAAAAEEREKHQPVFVYWFLLPVKLTGKIAKSGGEISPQKYDDVMMKDETVKFFDETFFFTDFV